MSSLRHKDSKTSMNDHINKLNNLQPQPTKGDSRVDKSLYQSLLSTITWQKLGNLGNGKRQAHSFTAYCGSYGRGWCSCHERKHSISSRNCDLRTISRSESFCVEV